MAFPGGPGGFRELLEAGRHHFHLSCLETRCRAAKKLAEADSDAKRSSVDSAMETVGSFVKLPAGKFNEDSFFSQVIQDAMAIKAAVDDPCPDVARCNEIACIFKKYDFGITTFLRALFIPVVQKNHGHVLKYAAEEQQSGVSPLDLTS